MNKIKFYSCLLTAASLMVACEDLPDEQFTKYANFTRSDYQEWVMEYDPSGEVTSDVSISISGTSVLSKDLKVEVELNTAKLDSFNFEKFRNETALYYEVLPEDCYEIADYGTTIKAGDEFGLMPVKFHLDKINKYKNYVLPLSIFRVSANSIALSPYYFTLMNIVLKNNFSGLYSSSLKCYSPDDKSTIEVKENQILRTVDDKTCYFYAAFIERANQIKKDYAINVKLNDDMTLTLTAVNPDIDFKASPSDTTPDKEVNAAVITQLTDKKSTIKLFLNYSYLDKSDPGFPVRREISGNIIREVVLK